MVGRDDVARLANVSPATVSRVVNNSKHVSYELKKKVLDAIDSLGYKPNLIAQGLASGNTRHVGIIVENIKNPYFGEIVEAMEEVAYKNGYIVSTFSRQYDLDEVYNNIRQRNLSGVFFAIVINDMKPEHIEILNKNDIYIVNNPFENTGPYIEVNMWPAIEQLASEFKKNGHRELGFVGRHEKGDLWLDALKNKGSVPQAGYFRYTNSYDADSGYRCTKQLLTKFPEITGLFCDNDLVALGAMRALSELSLRVPEDISIASCDDTYLAQFAQTPLTTLQMPKRELGIKAMELLLEQINAGTKINTVKTLEAKLILRDSIGRARDNAC